jgi:hypothetical protein
MDCKFGCVGNKRQTKNLQTSCVDDAIATSGLARVPFFETLNTKQFFWKIDIFYDLIFVAQFERRRMQAAEQRN